MTSSPAPTSIKAALLCALYCVATWAPSASVTADVDPADEPGCTKGNLRWSADDGVEYRRDKILLRNVIIYECGSPLRIEAQRAEASTLDFDNSTWTLTTNVKVRLIQGRLAADNAIVQFSDGKLDTATVIGTPASFEQQLARGHARTIIYKTAPGEVQFVGEAWLTNGCNEISGPSFSYNVVQKSVKTPPQHGGGGRVQGTIRPQCKPVPAAPATSLSLP